MAAKRILITFGLAALLAATGCRSWCERHYPCPAPVGCPAPVACAPCAPTASFSAPAPPANWSSPGPRNCRCVCD